MRSRLHGIIVSRASPPLRIDDSSSNEGSLFIYSTSNPPTTHRSIWSKALSELPPWLSLLVSCPNPSRFVLFRHGSAHFTQLFILPHCSCSNQLLRIDICERFEYHFILVFWFSFFRFLLLWILKMVKSLSVFPSPNSIFNSWLL